MRAFLAAMVAVVLAMPATAQVPATKDLPILFPASASVEQFVLTADGQRTYYTAPVGGIWMYDHASHTASRVSEDAAWDLAVSPKGDALVYTKADEMRRAQHVWVLPLSPATGLSALPGRRLTARSGDVPAISPDGKWVAFARDDASGVGQSVVVVSIDGGAERVIAATLPSSVSTIRWTPDGTTLYFGVNPPVSFTCAESCLSGARETRPQATIRRVVVERGAVQIVATVGQPFPGLSPDGRFLVFGDTGTSRQLVVADADGRRRQTFTSPAPRLPHTWMGGSTLLTLASGQLRRLRTLAIPDGAPRLVFESPEFAFEPIWSSDGRTISLMRFVGPVCEFTTMNADGSSPRSIAIGKAGECVSASWTRDQSWIVFTNYRPNDRSMITAYEVATGQFRELHPLPENNAEWVLDDKVVVLAAVVGTAGEPRHAVVSQIDLTGKITLLRDLVIDEAGAVIPLDRTRALVMRDRPRDFRVVSLADGEEKMLLPARGDFVNPRPSLSADRQWVAFQVSPGRGDNTRLSALELVRLDGSERRSIELPFGVEAWTKIAIAPGAAAVVVVERRGQNQASGVYLVDVAKKVTSKLFGYLPMGRFPDIVLSPDGRTLVYLLTETPPPTVSAIDISVLAPPDT